MWWWPHIHRSSSSIQCAWSRGVDAPMHSLAGSHWNGGLHGRVQYLLASNRQYSSTFRQNLESHKDQVKRWGQDQEVTLNHLAMMTIYFYRQTISQPNREPSPFSQFNGFRDQQNRGNQTWTFLGWSITSPKKWTMEPERCILRKKETHLQNTSLGLRCWFLGGVFVVDLTVLIYFPPRLLRRRRETRQAALANEAHGHLPQNQRHFPRWWSYQLEVGARVTPFIGGKTS